MHFGGKIRKGGRFERGDLGIDKGSCGPIFSVKRQTFFKGKIPRSSLGRAPDREQRGRGLTVHRSHGLICAGEKIVEAIFEEITGKFHGSVEKWKVLGPGDGRNNARTGKVKTHNAGGNDGIPGKSIGQAEGKPIKKPRSCERGLFRPGDRQSASGLLIVLGENGVLSFRNTGDAEGADGKGAVHIDIVGDKLLLGIPHVVPGNAFA